MKEDIELIFTIWNYDNLLVEDRNVATWNMDVGESPPSIFSVWSLCILNHTFYHLVLLSTSIKNVIFILLGQEYKQDYKRTVKQVSWYLIAPRNSS